jgi:hypothetical protein
MKGRPSEGECDNFEGRTASRTEGPLEGGGGSADVQGREGVCVFVVQQMGPGRGGGGGGGMTHTTLTGNFSK